MIHKRLGAKHWATAATLSVSLLAGCKAETKDAPEQKKPEPAPVVQEAAPPKPPRVAEPMMRTRRSHEAPFACDTLTAEEVALILAVESVDVLDVTESWSQRPQIGAESVCLYAYGENRNPDSINLESKFIRVDIFTEASLQNKGWGSLHDQWMSRSEWNARRFAFRDGVWAAWVESDHPPDPALLLRQGEIMIEVAHYPPSSTRHDPVKNDQIERLANVLLDRQDRIKNEE